MAPDPAPAKPVADVPPGHASLTDPLGDLAAVVFLMSLYTQAMLSKSRFDRKQAAQDLWIATEGLRQSFPQFGPVAPVMEAPGNGSDTPASSS